MARSSPLRSSRTAFPRRSRRMPALPRPPLPPRPPPRPRPNPRKTRRRNKNRRYRRFEDGAGRRRFFSPDERSVKSQPVDTFLQQIVNGLTLGCVYAVVALGYTMVYGIIQLINFAHGEVVMIGCMVAFSVVAALAGTGMPPLVIGGIGTVIAVPICMIVGFVIERAAYRPRRHAPRLAPLITAIG